MPNFDVQIRRGYRDIPGLVLDCLGSELEADEGTHTGSNNAAVLTDTGATWTPDSLIGSVVQNVTDGSYGVITDNTSTTVTATLSGGTDNDWDTGDSYSIVAARLEWENSAPSARPEKTGTHTGADNQATLTDSTKSWVPGSLVGMVIYNTTDGSLGWVTANTATTVSTTLAGGTDNDFDTGDEYAIRDPRFGNPYQETASAQPVIKTISGNRWAEFTRSKSHRMKVPLDYDIPPSWWTAAFDVVKGADATADQHIFDAPKLEIFSRHAGTGNYGYVHGTTVVEGSGAIVDGSWILQAIAATTQARMFRDGSSQLLGVAALAEMDAGDPAAFLGARGISAGFFDGRLRTMKLWNRALSPLEVDLAFSDLNPDTPYNTVTRAAVSLSVWTDETGDYSRINPSPAAVQRFYLANYSTGSPGRVQIAASVGGWVRPDSELGGDLFKITLIESPPAAGWPLIYQDAGWSAVFDVVVGVDGHYTFAISRDNGGGVIVHLDVEGV